MVWSVAGMIERGSLTRERPFRAPHHSASMAALTGGGHKAKPGEASLAHNGVLFLDELPEYSAQALDSLRQPLETGEIVVARANAKLAFEGSRAVKARKNTFSICSRLAAPTPCTARPDVRLVPPSIAR
jgi:magnesium chelatase family protein